MTCAPHSAQINLRFGNAAREFLDFRASVRSGHFARECLNFLRQIGVDKNGQAQPVAVRISRRALDGRLFWLNEGKLVPVTKNLFARAHHKHVATKRLVNRGSADEPVWESELCPFAPSDRALKALLTGTVQEGLAGRPLAGDGLLGRVPKA